MTLNLHTYRWHNECNIILNKHPPKNFVWLRSDTLRPLYFAISYVWWDLILHYSALAWDCKQQCGSLLAWNGITLPLGRRNSQLLFESMQSHEPHHTSRMMTQSSDPSHCIHTCLLSPYASPAVVAHVRPQRPSTNIPCHHAYIQKRRKISAPTHIRSKAY